MLITYIFKKQKGFTLIELLVVIAIIGLLSSIVLNSLNESRGKARDAKRKQDFHQISLAVEFYYDKYGGYPATGSTSATAGTYANTNPSWDGGLNAWTNLFTPLVSNGFMPDVPRDPVNVASGQWPFGYSGASVNRLYHYRSNGTLGNYDATVYLLCTWLENPDDSINLGHRDILDPFSGNLYLHADLDYSIYNYCVRNN